MALFVLYLVGFYTAAGIQSYGTVRHNDGENTYSTDTEIVSALVAGLFWPIALPIVIGRRLGYNRRIAAEAEKLRLAKQEMERRLYLEESDL